VGRELLERERLKRPFFIGKIGKKGFFINMAKTKEVSEENFEALLDKNDFTIPGIGETIKGSVISASKAEVRLDIGGILTGVVRGPELYEEDDDYANLKPGDEVEATVIDAENENGELELSFKYAGQEKAWNGLLSAYKDKTIIKVKVADANKGGLLVKYKQIAGFLPVSQLAPENYPRINGGDKGKILEKLRSFIGSEFEVKVMNLDEKEDKIIFSEKDAWNEKQSDVISKYKVGTKVEGTITAITDFGVFISFGENLEGLIHISELAWQRIDNPTDLYKVGDKIEAQVISLEDSKIFLSAKKLLKDPWEDVAKKYKVGQVVQGRILKVNPFGLFVELDEDIHGLAHISQLGLAPKQKVNEKFKVNEEVDFEIVSIEPKDHRLGLAYSDGKKSKAPKEDKVEKEEKEETEEDKEEESTEEEK
jgi:small subunit ribosomal protein S1